MSQFFFLVLDERKTSRRLEKESHAIAHIPRDGIRSRVLSCQIWSEVTGISCRPYPCRCTWTLLLTCFLLVRLNFLAFVSTQTSSNTAASIARPNTSTSFSSEH